MMHRSKFAGVGLFCILAQSLILNEGMLGAYAAPAPVSKNAPVSAQNAKVAPKATVAKPPVSKPVAGANAPAAKPLPVPVSRLSPAGQALVAAYDRYAAQVQGQVLNKWLVPEGKNKVVLSVIIEPDGTSGNFNVTSLPKNENAEQAARTAFQAAEPLSPLPVNSPPVKLQLTFVSQAEPHGESNGQLGIRIEPQQNLAAPSGGLPPLPSVPSE